jgi:hypothetical protein
MAIDGPREQADDAPSSMTDTVPEALIRSAASAEAPAFAVRV